MREATRGRLVTYSPKVFIPLTKLCRDVCHYCTFAKPPRRGERAYMTIDEVLAVARAGERAGCREALFTLGDKPELRYRAAREELAALGFGSTIEYVAAAASAVLEQTSLLPHANPGVLTPEDFALLRPVTASMGLMLETTADRLSARGGPHFGSPDKLPAARLETLRLAGEARVPFTTGVLIGIGETREERLDALRRDRRRRAARAGGDRSELPREAGDEDGRRVRAAARGAALDDRHGAARSSARDRRPGAAEPDRRVRGASRRGDRRLGRRLAGHDRPRQSRGAVARARAAPSRRPRAGASSSRRG